MFELCCLSGEPRHLALNAHELASQFPVVPTTQRVEEPRANHVCASERSGEDVCGQIGPSDSCRFTSPTSRFLHEVLVL